MRIHVNLPNKLIEDIDTLAGKGKRSEYITEAVAERARRDRLLKLLKETAGTLDLSRHPEWETPERVAEWIRELRDTPSVRRDPVDEVPVGLKRAHDMR